jgi:AcrR family transcriptional regulator
MAARGAAEAGTGPSRREQLLAVAAQLFAERGFHGVSIAELGAAVGISGPALYRHFPGKEALLTELLVGISRDLLAGGRAITAAHRDPQDALTALVRFQADFASREPELIVVQDRDLANLPPAERHRVRQLQRTYVEIWVDVLVRCHPGVPAESARTAAHAAFGLLNSTPHAGSREPGVAALLGHLALSALAGLPAAAGG